MSIIPHEPVLLKHIYLLSSNIPPRPFQGSSIHCKIRGVLPQLSTSRVIVCLGWKHVTLDTAYMRDMRNIYPLQYRYLY